MRTGIIVEFLSLLVMAGQAGTGYIFGKIQIERLMRIGVAGQAIVKLIVRFAFMAHGTLRNYFSSRRSMLNMAVLAGDFGTVLAAAGINCRRLLLVTFHTIAGRECGRLFSKGRKSKECHYDY